MPRPSPDRQRDQQREHQARQHNEQRSRRGEQMDPGTGTFTPCAVLPAHDLDVGGIGHRDAGYDRRRPVDHGEQRMDLLRVEESAFPSRLIVERDATQVQACDQADGGRRGAHVEDARRTGHQQRFSRFVPLAGEPAQRFGQRRVE